MTSNFKKCKPFCDLYDQYRLVKVLWKGTECIREHGGEFLPREPKETLTNYEMRLNRSTLFPKFKKTIKMASGKAMAKGIEIDAPERITEALKDVNESGDTFEQFIKNALEYSIRDGINYVLVDFPQIEDDVITLEQFNTMRPYLINIEAEQVCDAIVSRVDNVIQLTYFRFLENINQVSGTVTTNIHQAKEFIKHENGAIECNIYRKDDKDNEYLHNSFSLQGVDYIPIVPIYANKTAPYTGSPLLDDLAHMNVSHYQKLSDINNIIHASTVPMLILTGHNPSIDESGEEQEVIISPNSTLCIKDPNGKAEWLEVTGNGIKVALESLKELEHMMSLSGLELMTKQATGTETATGRLIDAAEANSMLKNIVMDLESSIIQILYFMATYLDINPELINVSIDATMTVYDSTDLSDIILMVQAGIITPEEALEEIKTKKLLVTNIERVEPLNDDNGENSQEDE